MYRYDNVKLKDVIVTQRVAAVSDTCELLKSVCGALRLFSDPQMHVSVHSVGMRVEMYFSQKIK